VVDRLADRGLDLRRHGRFAGEGIQIEQFHVGIASQVFACNIGETGIQFHGDHAAYSFGEKTGQAAGSASNFEDAIVRHEFRRRQELVHQVAVDEEALAEAFIGLETGLDEPVAQDRLGLER